MKIRKIITGKTIGIVMVLATLICCNNRNARLRTAVQEGNKDVAELLIAKGADVNATDKDGKAPLHYAANAVKGQKHVVEFLIAKGADVNARDKDGQTPLHRAANAVMGKKRTVELLIAKGADVNARDKDGQTPLSEAAESHHKDLVDLLIKHGAQK